MDPKQPLTCDDADSRGPGRHQPDTLSRSSNPTATAKLISLNPAAQGWQDSSPPLALHRGSVAWVCMGGHLGGCRALQEADSNLHEIAMGLVDVNSWYAVPIDEDTVEVDWLRTCRPGGPCVNHPRTCVGAGRRPEWERGRRRVSDADDDRTADGLDRLEVVVLRNDRQVVRCRDGWYPQVVDLCLSAVFRQFDQRGPLAGGAGVYRQRSASGSQKRVESCAVGPTRASSPEPGTGTAWRGQRLSGVDLAYPLLQRLHVR
jgi:hypothetical protein